MIHFNVFSHTLLIGKKIYISNHVMNFFSGYIIDWIDQWLDFHKRVFYMLQACIISKEISCRPAPEVINTNSAVISHKNLYEGYYLDDRHNIM